jgi:hypothetical protein
LKLRELAREFPETDWRIWSGTSAIKRLHGFPQITLYLLGASFQEHAIVAVLIYIFGFFVFSTFTATAEHWALEDPMRFLVFVLFFLGVWLALREWRRSLTYLDTQIIFEEKSSPAVGSMNLTYGP